MMNRSANGVNKYTNDANQGATFAITETKVYIPVVILSTQDKYKIINAIKMRF